MAPPFSPGRDQQYIQPGPVGTVLTSNGPTLNPSYQSAEGTFELSVAGNYNIQPTDGTIQAKGPNNQVLTLPTSAQMIAAGFKPGKSFTIVAQGDGYPITIQAQPGSNINRVSSLVLSTRFSAVTIYWDGFNYFISSLYAPAAEVINADKWYMQFDDTWIARRFPEAVYVSGCIIALGIADILIEKSMLNPDMMGIYDALIRRPLYPVAVYAATTFPFWPSSSVFD